MTLFVLQIGIFYDYLGIGPAEESRFWNLFKRSDELKIMHCLTCVDESRSVIVKK